MEKRGRKIQFNLSNRFLYTFIAIAVIISLGIVVYALAPGVAPNPGHTLSEVAPPAGCTSGQVLSWSGSAWSCVNNTGNGGEALKKKTVLYKTTSCTTQGLCGGNPPYTRSLGTANIVTTESSTGYSSSCLDDWGGTVGISCTASNTFIGYSVDAVIYNSYSQSYSGSGGYSATLNCLSGENIVSGGQTGCPGESDETLVYNGISGNGWRVECTDSDGGGVSFTISITCAK